MAVVVAVNNRNRNRGGNGKGGVLSWQQNHKDGDRNYKNSDRKNKDQRGGKRHNDKNVVSSFAKTPNNQKRVFRI